MAGFGRQMKPADPIGCSFLAFWLGRIETVSLVLAGRTGLRTLIEMFDLKRGVDRRSVGMGIASLRAEAKFVRLSEGL